MTRRLALASFLAAAAVLTGATGSVAAQPPGLPACDPDNGGIELPDGFCALVVADDLGGARHVEVAPNGDLYVSMRRVNADTPFAIIALRDTDGDGRADVREGFGRNGGTGLALRDGFLYFAKRAAVVRYPMRAGELLPTGPPETVATLPSQRAHAEKGIAFDGAGSLYVNVGAPSNACQDPDREEGIPGQNPCPQLEYHGGVWRFDADGLGQTQLKGGTRYATGMRQNLALAWNPTAGGLYLVQHGRDQLNTVWPDFYDDEQNAELPSEEFLRVEEGANFGWPYCYHDWQQGKRLQMPEYGGDGELVGSCDQHPAPIMGFPGHWAPNDLIFYTGGHFPERYRHGAFIAFHGSWNRAPLPQGGYKVVFVPFSGAQPSGDYETFADGFAGQTPLARPQDATYRPTGLGQGPDGSLYITDSKQGRVWRVVYRGGGPSAE